MKWNEIENVSLPSFRHQVVHVPYWAEHTDSNFLWGSEFDFDEFLLYLLVMHTTKHVYNKWFALTVTVTVTITITVVVSVAIHNNIQYRIWYM